MKKFMEKKHRQEKGNDSYKSRIDMHNKKTLKHLPKLKQDIIKSVFQTDSKRKYGDLVENIIKRKLKLKPGEKA